MPDNFSRRMKRAEQHAARSQRGGMISNEKETDCADLQQLDKLVTAQLGFLAQRRLARGVKLNHGEAVV